MTRSIEEINADLMQKRKELGIESGRAHTQTMGDILKDVFEKQRTPQGRVMTDEEVEKSRARQREYQAMIDKSDRRARRTIKANLLRASMATIPPRYTSARMRDFGRREIADSDAGWFIFGPNGTGKTHLASALVRRQMVPRNGTERAEWWYVPELLLAFRETFQKDAEQSEDEFCDRLAKTPLLVLDDLGAEKVSEWSQASLLSIINRRLDYMRPTIVTSNLTLNDLQAASPRTASRVSSYVQIKLDGADRRIRRGR